MISGTLLFLIALLLIIFIWQGNLRAKELALSSAKHLCEAEGVQLLDENVAGFKLGLSQFKLIRHYRFDYHTGNNVRYCGYISISQNEVISQKLTIASDRVIDDLPSVIKDTPAKVVDFAQYRASKNTE
ncbi:MAG: DUF3301 domain-containing protein [Gammaproteobacteria bacterium]|nr:DUF3301 domain-containing protein [Gammaproteobacteria bacterium]